MTIVSEPLYYVRVTEHTYTISPPEPNPDNEPYMDQGSTGIIADPVALYRSNPGETMWDVTRLDGDNLDVIDPPNEAYVVFVKYTDGDTFGSQGYWTIPAIRRSYEAAQADVKSIETSRDPQAGFKTPYREWDGYFAHLDSVEIVKLWVQA